MLRPLLLFFVLSTTAVFADVQERYVRSFPFAEPSILGQVQSQFIEVRLNDRRPQPFTLIKSCDAPFEIDAFATQLDGDRVVPVNGVLRLRIRFRPLVAGEYRDTIELVRAPDDIVIFYISGLGVSLSRRRNVEFGSVLTFDTTSLSAVVVRHPGVVSRWKMLRVSGDADDFALGLRQPVGIGNDSIVVTARFVPRESGLRECVAAYERTVEAGPGKVPVAVDTAVVVFSGIGVRQPAEVDVAVGGVVVDSVYTKAHIVDLPTRPSSAFVYRLRPTRWQHSDVAVSLVEPRPGVATTSAVIQLSVRFAPSVPSVVDHRVYLVRTALGIGDIDSTLITIRGEGVPRPEPPKPVFTLGFGEGALDTTWVRIGDTVRLYVTVRALEGVRTYEVRTSQLDVRYDPGILVPISTELVTRGGLYVEGIQAYARFFTSTLRPIVSGDTIAQAAFVAVAGHASSCDVYASSITLTPVAANQPNVVVSADTSIVKRAQTVALSNVWWSNGTPRLVNTMQGSISLSIEPNPVVDRTTIVVSTLPQEASSLTIVDALGRSVANLTSDLIAGQGSVTLDVRSLNMQPGTYYVRFLVRSPDGESLLSIVRLLIVA